MANSKTQARIQRWLAQEVPFRDQGAGEKYRAALQRFIDAVSLEREPDRVPVFITGTFLIPYLYELTPYEAMYDYDKLLEVHLRFLEDFDPDYAITPTTISSGRVLELIGFRQYRWPGHGVARESAYQYVEKEYMREDEYEDLINDPSDFWLRRYLPRVCEAFEPFADLNPLTDLWEIINYVPFMAPFGDDRFEEAFDRLLEAGREARRWLSGVRDFVTKAKAMGYPVLSGGATKAPFDFLADTLRGTKGALVDMYRRPELVQKAVERLTPIAIAQGVRGAERSGCPIVFIPLHKGSDEFMSDKQFRTFYWPSLKALIEGLVEEGCIPYVFAEGSYTNRLSYLKELPKGSGFWRFERTDMAKAKREIGDRLCIGGNVPAALLVSGTPKEVEEYCKKLIDTCAPGGGFILAPASTLDEARPENIRTMIEVAKTYGGYPR